MAQDSDDVFGREARLPFVVSEVLQLDDARVLGLRPRRGLNQLEQLPGLLEAYEHEQRGTQKAVSVLALQHQRGCAGEMGADLLDELPATFTGIRERNPHGF